MDKLSQSKTVDKGSRKEQKAFRANPNRSYDPPPMPNLEKEDQEERDYSRDGRKDRRKEKIIECLRNGMTYTQAAQAARVPRRTTYDWKKDDPEFAEECDIAIDQSIEEHAISAVQSAEKITVPGVKGYQLGLLHSYQSQRYLEVARMRLRTWRPRLEEGEGVRLLDYGLGAVIKETSLPSDSDGQGAGAAKVERGKKKLPSSK